jgi:uncharacterized protein (TIGR02444 family)
MSGVGETVGLQGDNPFWRFSLTVYGTRGVAEECLALQHSLGTDVNVLLFCAWLGAARGAVLTERDVEDIVERVRPWHEAVVRRIRAVRSGIKTMAEMAHANVRALREEIALVEIGAEQIEQALLFAHAERRWPEAGGRPRPDRVRANVQLVVEHGKRGHHPGNAPLSIELLVAAAEAPE